MKSIIKDDESGGSIDETPKLLTEKDLFSGGPEEKVPCQDWYNNQDYSKLWTIGKRFGSLFRLRHRSSISKEDSDSDSVVGSELKKKVGIMSVIQKLSNDAQDRFGRTLQYQGKPRMTRPFLEELQTIRRISVL